MTRSGPPFYGQLDDLRPSAFHRREQPDIDGHRRLMLGGKPDVSRRQRADVVTNAGLPITMRTVIADEIDDFQMALPDVHGSLIRTGPTKTACRVVVTASGPVRLATLDLGFAMAGEVNVHDDSLVLALVLGCAKQAKWDGIDLRPGQVFVYPPGGLHQAVDSVGMRVGMICVTAEDVWVAAEALGRPSGEIEHAVLDQREAAPLVSAFRCGFSSGCEMDSDEILRTVVSSLAAAEDDPIPVRLRSNRSIARAVLEHLDGTGEWQPSILSLCRAVGVSERRLQLAFADMFDTTPTAFVRNRALSAARQRILAASSAGGSVTTIAHAHGFRHLSRFATYYRTVFGELPSETLRFQP